MIAKYYALFGIVLLVAGFGTLGWGFLSYFDLKQAEIQYRGAQDSTPGSSVPYPVDNLFIERILAITALLSAGVIFLVKWKLARHIK